MALPENTSTDTTSDIDKSFVADREIFWSRFTSATTWATAAIVVLLIVLLIFVA